MSKNIPLSQNKVAIVDNEDHDFLMQWKWTYSRIPGYDNGYAIRIENRTSIAMHRVVMNPPDNLVVDHINGDGLDCRRSNLRVATVSQNMCNRKKQRNGITSQYQGVGWDSHAKRWVARVWLNGEKVHQSRHRTEEAAARMRDAKAKEWHGEFAHLNFPEDANAALA